MRTGSFALLAAFITSSSALAIECDRSRVLECKITYHSYSNGSYVPVFIPRLPVHFEQMMTDLDELPSYNCYAEINDTRFGVELLAHASMEIRNGYTQPENLYPLAFEIGPFDPLGMGKGVFRTNMDVPLNASREVFYKFLTPVQMANGYKIQSVSFSCKLR